MADGRLRLRLPIIPSLGLIIHPKKWRKEGEDKEGKEASPLGGMPANFNTEFRRHGNLNLIMFWKTPICNVYN